LTLVLQHKNGRSLKNCLLFTENCKSKGYFARIHRNTRNRRLLFGDWSVHQVARSSYCLCHTPQKEAGTHERTPTKFCTGYLHAINVAENYVLSHVRTSMLKQLKVKHRLPYLTNTAQLHCVGKTSKRPHASTLIAQNARPLERTNRGQARCENALLITAEPVTVWYNLKVSNYTLT
jgi:hypothetical protein